MSQSQQPPEPEIIPPGADAQKHPDASLSDVMNDPMMAPRAAYALYALAAVTGFPMLVGLIVAYVARGEAPLWLQSHYTFLIRTFWYFIALVIIGMALAFFVVGFMLLWVLPLWLVVRVVRGWLLLENRKPVPNPESWLFS